MESPQRQLQYADLTALHLKVSQDCQSPGQSSNTRVLVNPLKNRTFPVCLSSPASLLLVSLDGLPILAVTTFNLHVQNQGMSWCGGKFFYCHKLEKKLQFLKYFLYHSLTWNSENGTTASDTVGQLWDYTTLAASTSFSMPVWSLADPCYCPLPQSHCQDTRGLQTRGADAGVWIVAVKPERFLWEHVGNQSPYAGLPGLPGLLSQWYCFLHRSTECIFECLSLWIDFEI